MIRKGESIDSLECIRVYPLFLEDEGVGTGLPLWSELPRCRAPADPPPPPSSGRFQSLLERELRGPDPDYVLLVCVQMILDRPGEPPNVPPIAALPHPSHGDGADAPRPGLEKFWRRHLRDRIGCDEWRFLYRWVADRLHIVLAEPPLQLYAAQILPRLSAAERGRAAAALGLAAPRASLLGLQQQVQAAVAPASTPRRYGVVLAAPCPFRHSCCANATLEWGAVAAAAPAAVPSVAVVALYDLADGADVTVSLLPEDDGGDSMEERLRALERRSPDATCACPRCRHELAPTGPLPIVECLELARFYMSRGRLEEAQTLYRRVLKDDRDHLDACHALGAIRLSQEPKRFLEAQRLWAGAIERLPQECSMHAGMALQAEKLRAYRYLAAASTAPSPGATDAVAPFRTLLPGVYCAPMLDRDACRRILFWAHAAEGWTRNRHYAVPTHDIPVHVVPPLLDWFRDWCTRRLRPLLARQFGTSTHYFVHDAFVVQYRAPTGAAAAPAPSPTATAAPGHYLPLHRDESTHSLVLALNDGSDYKGGGTYFDEGDLTYRANVGEVVSFRGDQVLHGGEAVTEGTRYILAVFLYNDDDGACPIDGVLGASTKRDRTNDSVSQVLRESKAQKVDFSFSFIS